MTRNIFAALAALCLLVAACTTTPTGQSVPDIQTIRVGLEAARVTATVFRDRLPAKSLPLIDAAFVVAGDAIDGAAKAQAVGDGVTLAASLAAARGALDQVEVLLAPAKGN
ncbi:hypothetical protein [Azospirillum cavernae]|nr:hypothetical protein [Azospirillum cavernae]